MLTREDCLALCDVDADMVEAISQHEHVPEIVAAELGCYLTRTPEGQLRIRSMILDDIAEAVAGCDLKRALRLRLALRHFALSHPLPPGFEPPAPGAPPARNESPAGARP
jgi:hypothetical protein